MNFTIDYNNKNAIRAWSGLSYAVFDRNGNLIKENNPMFCAPGLTEKEKVEARDMISKMAAAPFDCPVFIRFGDLPKSGKSTNYATGREEVGVSCYSATWDLIAGCYERTGDGLDGAMIAYTLSGAPVYLISGDEIGKGSDGEPVITNAKILAKLIYSKEKNGYICA